MNHSTPIIEGCDLSIGYRSGKQVKTVHRHLNFSLHQGELTCLLGANGAGKSTLLRTLAATQMPLEVPSNCWDVPSHPIPNGNVRAPSEWY